MIMFEPTTPRPVVEATATLVIESSEAPQLAHVIGQPLALGYGAALLEAEHVREQIERGGRGGYCKTGFAVTFTRDGQESTWRGRYDLGCDAPTLAEHITGAVKHARDWYRHLGRTDEQLDEMERDAEHIARCIDAQRQGHTYYFG